jgi:rSAM/selenodomain-associated transferase 1
MKKALIVFARRPELGKVKTRLAATLGNEITLSIYKKLLQHTLDITLPVAADKFVFYASEIVEDDMWQKEGYFKLKQADGDLGTRMQAAFEYVLSLGYEKVCIIGSDCYELNTSLIEEAFHLLNAHDTAIGPAKDGGYYLLAMKKLHPTVFKNKAWSTDTVFADTIKSMNAGGITYAELPLLSDVDQEADVPKEWLPVSG